MAGNKKPRKERKSAGVRKTLLTATPIVIRQSKEENEKIRQRPWNSLCAFKTNKAILDDWVTLLYRLILGRQLTESHFENMGLAELVAGLTAVCDIYERHKTTSVWSLLPIEASIISDAIELVDQMQDKTTRKELLQAFLTADRNMEQHLKTVNIKDRVLAPFGLGNLANKHKAEIEQQQNAKKEHKLPSAQTNQTEVLC